MNSSNSRSRSRALSDDPSSASTSTPTPTPPPLVWESPSKRPTNEPEKYLSHKRKTMKKNNSKKNSRWHDIQNSVLAAKTTRKQTEKEIMEQNQSGVGPLIKNFDMNKKATSPNTPSSSFSTTSVNTTVTTTSPTNKNNSTTTAATTTTVPIFTTNKKVVKASGNNNSNGTGVAPPDVKTRLNKFRRDNNAVGSSNSNSSRKPNASIRSASTTNSYSKTNDLNKNNTNSSANSVPYLNVPLRSASESRIDRRKTNKNGNDGDNNDNDENDKPFWLKHLKKKNSNLNLLNISNNENNQDNEVNNDKNKNNVNNSKISHVSTSSNKPIDQKNQKNKNMMTQDDSNYNRSSGDSHGGRGSSLASMKANKWKSCADLDTNNERRGRSLNRVVDDLSNSDSSSIFSTSTPKLRNTGFFKNDYNSDNKTLNHSKEDNHNNNDNNNNVGDSEGKTMILKTSDRGAVVWDPASKRKILMRRPGSVSPAPPSPSLSLKPSSSSSSTTSKPSSPSSTIMTNDPKNNELIEVSNKPSSIHGVKLKPASLRPLKNKPLVPSSSSSSLSSPKSSLSKVPLIGDRGTNTDKESDEEDSSLFHLSQTSLTNAVTSSVVLSPQTKFDLVEHEADFRKASIAVHSIQREENERNSPLKQRPTPSSSISPPSSSSSSLDIDLFKEEKETNVQQPLPPLQPLPQEQASLLEDHIIKPISSPSSISTAATSKRLAKTKLISEKNNRRKNSIGEYSEDDMNDNEVAPPSGTTTSSASSSEAVSSTVNPQSMTPLIKKIDEKNEEDNQDN